MDMIREICKNVFHVGAIDWDRRLFDALIPLPDGTSYNSYLIKGSEKTALIDAVDPGKKDVLIDNLDSLRIDRIDYIISQHAEQDHSGAIKFLLERYDSTVLGSQKCIELLLDFGIVSKDRTRAVSDNELLSLGDMTLEFISAPWVHWPDTIFTYLRERRMLFTCDFLGAHLATSDLFAWNPESAKRYYAEIMMPFRANARRHLERIRALGPEIIAPSHGPLHKRPEVVLNAYSEWTSDDVKNLVVVPFVSMHGSTEKMVSHLVDALIDRGVSVERFDLTKTDTGALAASLVDAATVVFGTPAFITRPHPLIAYAAILANALRPKARFASIIGSYGWGARIVEEMRSLMPNLKMEIIEPVIVKGYPKEDDLRAIERLADEILRRHRELGLL
ncbi:FprA family A-type flavoprotein [Methanothrix sp.]|jgi:Uncharacterized flavoproteins|nr:FprA family A-type flavoprotein [Methanothrix sp.]